MLVNCVVRSAVLFALVPADSPFSLSPSEDDDQDEVGGCFVPESQCLSEPVLWPEICCDDRPDAGSRRASVSACCCRRGHCWLRLAACLMYNDNPAVPPWPAINQWTPLSPAA